MNCLVIWRVAGVRFIGAVLKIADGAEPSVGSNPTPSSIIRFVQPRVLNMRKILVGRVRGCNPLVSEFDSHLLLHMPR